MDHFLENTGILRIGRFEHIGFDRFTMEGSAYPELQPREILMAQVLDNGKDAPVTARSSSSDQADSAARQVQIVVYDEHTVSGKTEVPEHSTYRFPTPIHIGQRLKEYDFSPPK